MNIKSYEHILCQKHSDWQKPYRYTHSLFFLFYYFSLGLYFCNFMRVGSLYMFFLVVFAIYSLLSIFHNNKVDFQGHVLSSSPHHEDKTSYSSYAQHLTADMKQLLPIQMKEICIMLLAHIEGVSDLIEPELSATYFLKTILILMKDRK